MGAFGARKYLSRAVYPHSILPSNIVLPIVAEMLNQSLHASVEASKWRSVQDLNVCAHVSDPITRTLILSRRNIVQRTETFAEGASNAVQNSLLLADLATSAFIFRTVGVTVTFST